MKNKIAVAPINAQFQQQAQALAEKLHLPCVSVEDQQYPYLLVFTDERLELRTTTARTKPIFVDFIYGKMGHRLQYGGGKRQLIARAVGLRGKSHLSILDVTAGLGRDAFVLAYLGCRVTMIERSPIIVALLEDGLRRARAHEWVRALSIKLIQAEAKQYLHQLNPIQYPEVIYLDPMFPIGKKSALVKKEMRVLRDIVGEDVDASELLAIAMQYATQRVVVKRARLATKIPGPKPNIVFIGKSSRFDVYLSSNIVT